LIHIVRENPRLLARLGNAVRRRFTRRRATSWQPSEETQRNWEDMRAIPASQLDGVIGVGQSVSTAAVTVELLALEMRAKGAVLHWRARSSREAILMSPAVSIADRDGTRLRVIGGGGGGSPEGWEGQTFVMPPPPTGARLTITLESFGPSTDRPVPRHVPTETVPGPWEFVVDVPELATATRPDR